MLFHCCDVLNYQNALLWPLTSLRRSSEQPRGRRLIFLFLSRACSCRLPSHSFSLFSFLSASRWSLTSLLVARPRRSSGPCSGWRGRRRVCCQALHRTSRVETNEWRVDWGRLCGWVGALVPRGRFNFETPEVSKVRQRVFHVVVIWRQNIKMERKKKPSAHLKAHPQTAPVPLPAWMVLLSRRPPVCLNFISITDQLVHSISKHTLSHMHTEPSQSNCWKRKPIPKHGRAIGLFGSMQWLIHVGRRERICNKYNRVDDLHVNDEWRSGWDHWRKKSGWGGGGCYCGGQPISCRLTLLNVSLQQLAFASAATCKQHADGLSIIMSEANVSEANFRN